MEWISEELDRSLYGTDNAFLCNRLRSSTFRVIEHKDEMLPNIYNRLLRDKQFYKLFVRSPMGSGKTFQLKNIILNFKRSAASTRRELKVLIITPKRTFASYVGNQLPNFVDYRSVKKPFSYQKHPRFIVQLQSLRNFKDILTDTAYVKGYTLVIMDEVHSLIDELFSDLFTPKEKKMFINIFVKVLRAIPRWVCLDAHLSFDLIKMLTAIDDESCIDKHRLCLINTFTHRNFKLVFYRKCLYNTFVVNLLRKRLCISQQFSKYKSLLATQCIENLVVDLSEDQVDKIFRKIYKRDMTNSPDKNDILFDISNLLKRGEKVCVTTSTKRQAILLKRFFKSMDSKVILLTGDTAEEQKRSFAKDPDRFVRKCQLFIYTTAFQVGIDVSSCIPYFDTHFVFIECGIGVATPGAFVQAVGRIRKIRSNEYRIVVIDKEHKSKTNLNSSDFIPLDHNVIIPTGKHDEEILRDLVNFHFKEKALGKSTTIYVEMFIRLMSCRAEPYVTINGNMYPSNDIVNFSNFRYRYEDYSKFVDDFILSHADDIQSRLDKLVGNIWKKLEISSIFVSTLVNNYQAFISLPEGMSRSECLLNVCEFTTCSFGFLHTFLFCSNEIFLRNERYFEKNIRSYFPKADINDLKRIKWLLAEFLGTCKKTDHHLYMKIDHCKFERFLKSYSSDIVQCYSKLVSSYISKSIKIKELFSKLVAKTIRVYIRKDVFDFSEIPKYKQVINLDKLIEYNVQSHL